MPGWIITGVRGEGKTLAAVCRIKKYALEGRPIATNLDLYLDKFLPDDNNALIYRLPDKPRLEDFELLPPAYDVDYKAEDKNGLLVLDELGTWLNSRSWNDKSRLPMLNWLFLSRKLHWDIILLAQDYEMIDAQVRNTLCDYWVQSSRLDRQKIPYLAPLLDALGINSFMPRVHRYFVFYGFSAQQKPVETWTFTGKDFYDGYNTNQRFLDGFSVIDGELVDARCVTTYLPASYLSGHYYIQRLQNHFEQLKAQYSKELEQLKAQYSKDKQVKDKQGDNMAVKKSVGADPRLKAYFLLIALAAFMAYRFFLADSNPLLNKATAQPTANALPATPTPSLPSLSSATPAPAPVSASLPVASASTTTILTPSASPSTSAPETFNFIDELLARSRPRLSLTIYSEEQGFQGSIDFYRGNELVERFKVSELHALGVVLMRTPYGIDLIYKGKSYLVSAWVLPNQANQPQANPTSNKAS